MYTDSNLVQDIRMMVETEYTGCFCCCIRRLYTLPKYLELNAYVNYTRSCVDKKIHALAHAQLLQQSGQKNKEEQFHISAVSEAVFYDTKTCAWLHHRT